MIKAFTLDFASTCRRFPLTRQKSRPASTGRPSFILSTSRCLLRCQSSDSVQQKEHAVEMNSPAPRGRAGDFYSELPNIFGTKQPRASEDPVLFKGVTGGIAFFMLTTRGDSDNSVRCGGRRWGAYLPRKNQTRRA